MHFRNPFKSKTVDEKAALQNQKILDNIMAFMETETDKNLELVSAKNTGWVEARKRVDFIRDIYKIMNKN